MLNRFLHNKMTDQGLKKTRLITGVLFCILYPILLYLAYGPSKLDMMEYNRVWLSLDTQVVSTYYANMIANGTFFYYTLAHIIDFFFPLVYAPFFISITELSKRRSQPHKNHYKAASLFIWLIMILAFLDFVETGALLISVGTNPAIPSGIVITHVISKSATGFIFYAVIGWFLYLIGRAIVWKIKGRK